MVIGVLRLAQWNEALGTIYTTFVTCFPKGKGFDLQDYSKSMLGRTTQVQSPGRGRELPFRAYQTCAIPTSTAGSWSVSDMYSQGGANAEHTICRHDCSVMQNDISPILVAVLALFSVVSSISTRCLHGKRVVCRPSLSD